MFSFFRKTNLIESGFFERHVDYHSHILPGVDDGASDIAESKSLLKILVKLGVKELWLTPHVMEDQPNNPEGLTSSFSSFKNDMDHCYGIKLHLASENMLDSLFRQRLVDNEILPIIDDRHLLIETSYFNGPLGLSGILSEIKDKGYVPVLAHPERFNYMVMADYVSLKKEGVMFQLNYLSLLGAYGPLVTKKALWILEKGMYDITGSDIHSSDGFMDYVNVPLKTKVIDKLNCLH